MVCEALSQGEIKCGKGGVLPYFWFNDSSGAFDKKFEICQKDSDEIFGRLLRPEYMIKNTIDTLDKKIKNATVGNKKNQQQLSTLTFQDRSKENERDKKEKAKEISDLSKDIHEWYEKKSRMNKILKKMRNKECRLCQHDLECDCSECAKRQTTNRYSSADLHSARGFIREKIMFHTLCGRIWVLQVMSVDQKLKQALLPSKTGQYTLEQSLSTTKLKVN